MNQITKIKFFFGKKKYQYYQTKWLLNVIDNNNNNNKFVRIESKQTISEWMIENKTHTKQKYPKMTVLIYNCRPKNNKRVIWQKSNNKQKTKKQTTKDKLNEKWNFLFCFVYLVYHRYCFYHKLLQKENCESSISFNRFEHLTYGSDNQCTGILICKKKTTEETDCFFLALFFWICRQKKNGSFFIIIIKWMKMYKCEKE